MICSKCRAKIDINLDRFVIINGIGFFKCDKCGFQNNKDVDLTESAVEKIYFDISKD